MVKADFVDFDETVAVSCDGVECRIVICMKLQSILQLFRSMIAQSIAYCDDTAIHLGNDIKNFVIQPFVICGIDPDALDYRVLLHCI
jgi:hypothetical protein